MWLCNTRRLKSAKASAQSGRSFCCPHVLSYQLGADAQSDLSLPLAKTHFVGFVISWVILAWANSVCSFRFKLDFYCVPGTQGIFGLLGSKWFCWLIYFLWCVSDQCSIMMWLVDWLPSLVRMRLKILKRRRPFCFILPSTWMNTSYRYI